eukprot:5466169-Pyramimonas_sp.AAC.2
MVLVGGAAKQVRQALENYQIARMAFISEVGTLMKKKDPLVLQTFMQADIVSLLMKPLIQDTIATVRISALDVLSNIAELTDEADDQFTDAKELAKMKTSLVCPNSKVQRSGCLALSAIACKAPSHANSGKLW